MIYFKIPLAKLQEFMNRSLQDSFLRFHQELLWNFSKRLPKESLSEITTVTSSKITPGIAPIKNLPVISLENFSTDSFRKSSSDWSKKSFRDCFRDSYTVSSRSYFQNSYGNTCKDLLRELLQWIYAELLFQGIPPWIPPRITDITTTSTKNTPKEITKTFCTRFHQESI